MDPCPKHEEIENSLNELKFDVKIIKEAVVGTPDKQGICDKVRILWAVSKYQLGIFIALTISTIGLLIKEFWSSHFK